LVLPGSSLSIARNKKVIGFGARAMEKDAIPKYINSPESGVFSKRFSLFGIDKARKHITEKNEVLFASLTVGGETKKYYRFQTPDDAVVTSILWGWPSDTCVVATRVEHMQWLSGSLPMK